MNFSVLGHCNTALVSRNGVEIISTVIAQAGFDFSVNSILNYNSYRFCLCHYKKCTILYKVSNEIIFYKRNYMKYMSVYIGFASGFRKDEKKGLTKLI